MFAHVAQTTDPVELLGDVTTTDPLAAALLAAGVLLMGSTMAFVGYLTGGALLEAILHPFE